MNYFLFLFLELCKYNKPIESRSDGPAGHERDFLLPITSLQDFHISWLYYLFLTDNVGEFLLVVIDNNLVPKSKFVKEGENAVVFSFYPGIIGAVPEYEGIS